MIFRDSKTIGAGLLNLIHQELVKAGVPEKDLLTRFPFAPVALEEHFEPWDDSHLPELRELLQEYLEALAAGVPQSHLFEGLEHGAWPRVAQRSWDLGRSIVDYRTVMAFTYAEAVAELVPTSHPADIDRVVRDAFDRGWAWLATPVPVTRIATYVEARISLDTARTSYEPRLAVGESFEAAEMLASLRRTPESLETVRWQMY